jgi:NAD-dependent deacetylase
LEAARVEADRADCVVAIGTSGTVRPASGLAWIAHANGAKVIEINPNETKLTPIAAVCVRADAAEALPELHRALSSLPGT